MPKKSVNTNECKTLVLKAITVEDIEPGYYIPPEVIERASGVSRNHALYSRILQDVKEVLEAMLSRLGRDWILAGQNSGIRVLETGGESMIYGWAQAEQGLNKTDRWFHKTTLCVDRNKLSPVELETHERKAREIGRILLHRSEDKIKGMEDDGLPREEPPAELDEDS